MAEYTDPHIAAIDIVAQEGGLTYELVVDFQSRSATGEVQKRFTAVIGESDEVLAELVAMKDAYKTELINGGANVVLASTALSSLS